MAFAAELGPHIDGGGNNALESCGYRGEGGARPAAPLLLSLTP